MSESVFLLNAAPTTLTRADLDSILDEARSSGFLAEASDGEPPEESGLWNAVVIGPDGLVGETEDIDTQDEQALERIVHQVRQRPKAEGNDALAVALADAQTKKDRSVLVLEIQQQGDDKSKGSIRDKLRVTPKSLIEVVSIGLLSCAVVGVCSDDCARIGCSRIHSLPLFAVEKCCNLNLANMDLAEYRQMMKSSQGDSAEILDSGH